MTDLSAAPTRQSAWEHWWDGAAEWVTGTGNTEGLGLLAFCAGWDAAAPHIRAQVHAEIRQQLLAEADRGQKIGLDRIALRAFAHRLSPDGNGGTDG